MLLSEIKSCGKYYLQLSRIAGILLLICFSIVSSSAQIHQSSGFFKVKSGDPKSGDGDNQTVAKIEKGKGYLTITFVDGLVYDPNPLKRFWKTDRKLVSLFSTEGNLPNNISLNQGRTRSISSPNNATITTIKNGAPYSLGWSNINIVDGIPNDFSNLKLVVNITTSAKNGFDDVFSTLNLVSATFPSLTANAASQGILSGTKGVVNLLLERKLVERVIDAEYGINYGTEAGFYVNFSSDNQEAWSVYKQDAQNLYWHNNTLWHKSGDSVKPVSKVSYIVMNLQVTDLWDNNTFEQWQQNVFALEDKLWKMNFNRAFALRRALGTNNSTALIDNIRTLVENGKNSLRSDPAVSEGDKLKIIKVVDDFFSK